MNNLKKDKKKGNIFLETIFAIVVSTIFMLIGVYYISWFMFLYPVAFVILGVRHGINYNILSLLISTLILGMITGMVSAISIFVAFAPLSVVLSYTIKNRKKSFDIILTSTLFLFISLLSIIIIMKGMTGVSVINQLEDFFAQTLDIQMGALKNMNLSSYEISKVVDVLENFMKYTILILPSIIMISSLVIAYINYLVSALILRRLGYGIVSIPKFSRFQLPNNILLGTGIMFLGAFILKVLKLFYYETILLNITVIVSFMFFAQGLSVIDYKLIQRKTPMLLRVFIIIVFAMLLPFGWMISILGVLDVIIDFRKLRRPI